MSLAPSLSAIHLPVTDPACMAMLTILSDQRALPAGELADASGISVQAARFRLAQLVADGLVSIETAGWHRYYRLAGSHVAYVLEQLAAVRPETPIKRRALSAQGRQLRFCRCCYGHLAGQVGVAVAQALQARRYICPASDKQFEVTLAGIEWFGSIGLDVRTIRPTRRGLAWQCLDWTEREHHLAGPLGGQFMSLLCSNDWLQRSESSRVVVVTPKGWAGLQTQLGIDEIQTDAR
ncbi:MAG TPA: helix-turn-helix domain-containing protein [Burkholderiales bacterium]